MFLSRADLSNCTHPHAGPSKVGKSVVALIINQVDLHDNESWLHTRFEKTEQETHNHERSESCRSRGASHHDAPAEHICGEVLCRREFLEQYVGGPFAGQDAHVQDGAQPRVSLTLIEMSIVLDAHDRRKLKCSFVEGLAEVCS